MRFRGQGELNRLQRVQPQGLSKCGATAVGGGTPSPVIGASGGPTPMLAVGYRAFAGQAEYNLVLALVAKGQASSPSGFPIHECPKCGANDAGSYDYQRTTPR